MWAEKLLSSTDFSLLVQHFSHLLFWWVLALHIHLLKQALVACTLSSDFSILDLAVEWRFMTAAMRDERVCPPSDLHLCSVQSSFFDWYLVQITIISIFNPNLFLVGWSSFPQRISVVLESYNSRLFSEKKSVRNKSQVRPTICHRSKKQQEISVYL